MHRRHFLAGLAGLAAAGAADALASRPRGRAEEAPPRTRLVIPGMAADRTPPRVTTSITRVYQGGALLVRVVPGMSGSATLFGRPYALEPANGAIEGFVGVAVGDPPGPALLAVTASTPLETVSLSVALDILATSWTVDYIDLPPGTGALLDPAILQAEANLLAAVYAERTPRVWLDGWASPVDPPLTPAIISGYFGEQRSFNGGPPSGHHGGTDFGLPLGEPVRSTNRGTVVLARALAVRGNMVIVDHGGGIFSGYAHLDTIAVAESELVGRGQLLGTVGTTGLSTGPHLHWELSVAGVLIDGLRWLDGTQGF
jgi:murein DD-endopeptidase MepM/ murein hydrolase activator NlpD